MRGILRLVVSFICLGLVACKADPKAAPTSTEKIGPTASASTPVDQLPQGIVEGTEVAFGFKIPAGMTVLSRFPDAVTAKGPLPFPELQTYVQARIVSELPKNEGQRVTFANATLRDQPTQKLEIVVFAHKRTTELIIRDVNPAPPEEGVSVEERARRAEARSVD